MPRGLEKHDVYGASHSSHEYHDALRSQLESRNIIEQRVKALKQEETSLKEWRQTLEKWKQKLNGLKGNNRQVEEKLAEFDKREQELRASLPLSRILGNVSQENLRATQQEHRGLIYDKLEALHNERDTFEESQLFIDYQTHQMEFPLYQEDLAHYKGAETKFFQDTKKLVEDAGKQGIHY
jgi:small-conductance mechanosensitive channel